MSMSIILRLIVMLVAAGLGLEIGGMIEGWGLSSQIPLTGWVYRTVMTVLAGALGFAFAQHVTVKPYHAIRRVLWTMPVRTLLVALVGLLLGLVMGALLSIPLSMLPGIVGSVTPILGAVVLSILSVATLAKRDRDILSLLGLFVSKESIRRKRNVVLLDTSVIIDGRIADICKTGFIDGAIIVPQFVLDELQHIADSPIALRRNRGRRGLDVLSKLQEDDGIQLEISEMDLASVPEVDGKLVALARRLDCPVLTNDYNLNRVAELQGVRVLNINELANAVKVVLLPGETLEMQIIQEGKEMDQGVGYLDDGTMVVVQGGKHLIGQSVEVEVTRVLQTVAGRMVFGQIQDRRR